MTSLDMGPSQTDKKRIRTVSRFREVLPQVLAMSAANMVVINLTVALFLSTLVIAEVHNKEGDLSMNDNQASWFGSLPFFCQPIGSLASGFLVQWLGRRKSLLLINVPYLLGCIIVSVAPSVTVLFLANILLGTTVGFTEAPINSYFGEICQPELRSILAGSAAIFYQLGMFMLFVLGSLTHWRTTAAIVTLFPVLTILCFTRVPESPIWLIAQGRIDDAEEALCWLRGWVDKSAVQQELAELKKYHESVTMKSAAPTRQDSEKNISLQTLNVNESKESQEFTNLLSNDNQLSNDDLQTKQMRIYNDHPSSPTDNRSSLGNESSMEIVAKVNDDEKNRFTSQSEKEKTRGNGFSPEMDVENDPEKSTTVSRFVGMVRLLIEPETLRPLFLTVSFFTFYGFGAMPSIRPFLVEVIDSFHTPIKGTWNTVVIASTGFLGSIVLISTVNRFGKRSIALISTAVCAICCLSLGLYAYLFIVPATRTGDDSHLVATWLPLLLFAVFSFSSIIHGQIPWLLVAEAFPYRTRGVAGGMAAASNYIVSFVAARTFLSTEHSLQLYGSFWFFGAINCLCFVFLYFQLPETEGKSLQEIERLFAGKKDDTTTK